MIDHTVFLSDTIAVKNEPEWEIEIVNISQNSTRELLERLNSDMENTMRELISVDRSPEPEEETNIDNTDSINNTDLSTSTSIHSPTFFNPIRPLSSYRDLSPQSIAFIVLGVIVLVLFTIVIYRIIMH